MVILLILTCINILIHTLFIGSGVFNPEVAENYMNSLAAGLVIYTLIIGTIAASCAYLRKFSFFGFKKRFLMYSICLQSFLLFVHTYQALIDWLF